jgi:hypothetical protein
MLPQSPFGSQDIESYETNPQLATASVANIKPETANVKRSRSNFLAGCVTAPGSIMTSA